MKQTKSVKHTWLLWVGVPLLVLGLCFVLLCWSIRSSCGMPSPLLIPAPPPQWYDPGIAYLSALLCQS